MEFNVFFPLHVHIYIGCFETYNAAFINCLPTFFVIFIVGYRNCKLYSISTAGSCIHTEITDKIRILIFVLANIIDNGWWSMSKNTFWKCYFFTKNLNLQSISILSHFGVLIFSEFSISNLREYSFFIRKILDFFIFWLFACYYNRLRCLRCSLFFRSIWGIFKTGFGLCSVRCHTNNCSCHLICFIGVGWRSNYIRNLIYWSCLSHI